LGRIAGRMKPVSGRGHGPAAFLILAGRLKLRPPRPARFAFNP